MNRGRTNLSAFPRTKCASFLMKRDSNKTFSANTNGTYIAIRAVTKPTEVCSAVDSGKNKGDRRSVNC
jgi:hypothetical protein